MGAHPRNSAAHPPLIGGGGSDSSSARAGLQGRVGFVNYAGGVVLMPAVMLWWLGDVRYRSSQRVRGGAKEAWELHGSMLSGGGGGTWRGGQGTVPILKPGDLMIYLISISSLFFGTGCMSRRRGCLSKG